MITVTSTEAENRLCELLETAQKDVVAITREGEPTAYVVSSREIEGLIEIQRRRRQAADEYRAWQQEAEKTAHPEAILLTEEQINRMVHESR